MACALGAPWVMDVISFLLHMGNNGTTFDVPRPAA
jgi:hypothetical protein